MEVSSRSNPNLVALREVFFHVKNARRNFRVDGSRSFEMQEGNSLRIPFTIVNDDFPKAPHSITYTIPDNNIQLNLLNQLQIEIDEKDPLKFYVNLNIPFDFIRLNRIMKYNRLFVLKEEDTLGFETRKISPYECDGTSCLLNGAFAILIRDPDFRLTTLDLLFKLTDIRQPPRVIAPSNIKIEKNVRFPIMAYDLNKEYRPRIRLKSITGNMPGGDLKCYDENPNGKDISSKNTDPLPCDRLFVEGTPASEADESPDQTFYRVVNVEWLNIPENLLANEDALTWDFEICTIGNQFINKKTKEILFNNCIIHTVILENDDFVPPPGPVFEHGKREPMLYFKNNDTVNIPLHISESDDKDIAPHNVSVKAVITKKQEDAEPRNINARWDPDNETIIFRSPSIYGIYEIKFTVLAFSRYGAQSTENFSIDFETIPPELFITTSDLIGDPHIDKKLDYVALNTTKDIFIHTPHLDRLPPAIQQTLEGMGVIIRKNVLHKEDLSKREIYSETTKTRLPSKIFLLDLQENETVPTLVYYDKGKKTNPLSFCEEIFSISKKPEDDINSATSTLPVAIRCIIITDPTRNTPPSDFQRGGNKQNGIVFVIMGFEYNKLQAEDPSDQVRVKGWKKTLFNP